MYLANKYANPTLESVNGTDQYEYNFSEAKEAKQNRVLLVDCDFRGAGIETQLLNTFYLRTEEEYYSAILLRNESEYQKESLVDDGELVCTQKASQYFNRYMMRNEAPVLSACISKMRIYRKVGATTITPQRNIRLGFDVMFADSGSDAKRAFLASASRQDGSVVDISYFKRSFGEMLKNLQDKYPEYTDIIIDMSPGTDEYVDRIMDACLDENLEKDNYVTLYAVTTSDTPHMFAMEEYLENTIANRHFKQRDFDEYHLIVNETRRYYWNHKFDVRAHDTGAIVIAGDPGGMNGIANAKNVAQRILENVGYNINKPNGVVEVFSQLIFADYLFDNLSCFRYMDGLPITKVLLALIEEINPGKELELNDSSNSDFNRRYELPHLFWTLGENAEPLLDAPVEVSI